MQPRILPHLCPFCNILGRTQEQRYRGRVSDGLGAGGLSARREDGFGVNVLWGDFHPAQGVPFTGRRYAVHIDSRVMRMYDAQHHGASNHRTMRTTLAIDDDVLAAAKRLAERERKRVGEVSPPWRGRASAGERAARIRCAMAYRYCQRERAGRP